jgi:hypothetical protein
VATSGPILKRKPVEVLLGWWPEEQNRMPTYTNEPVTIEGYTNEFLRAVRAMPITDRIRRAIFEAEEAGRCRDEQRMRWALEELVHIVRGHVS